MTARASLVSVALVLGVFAGLSLQGTATDAQPPAKRTLWEYGELKWLHLSHNRFAYEWSGPDGQVRAETLKELCEKLQFKLDPKVAKELHLAKEFLTVPNAFGSDGWELVVYQSRTIPQNGPFVGSVPGPLGGWEVPRHVDQWLFKRQK